MMDKGYNPDHNVMDGGSGMDKAFTEVLPNVRLDMIIFMLYKASKRPLDS